MLFQKDGTFYIPNTHSNIGRVLNLFFRISNQIANKATQMFNIFNSRMANSKTDMY